MPDFIRFFLIPRSPEVFFNNERHEIFVLLSLDFFFFMKDFQKTDAQVTGFEVLSHF